MRGRRGLFSHPLPQKSARALRTVASPRQKVRFPPPAFKRRAKRGGGGNGKGGRTPGHGARGPRAGKRAGVRRHTRTRAAWPGLAAWRLLAVPSPLYIHSGGGEGPHGKPSPPKRRKPARSGGPGATAPNIKPTKPPGGRTQQGARAPKAREFP